MCSADASSTTAAYFSDPAVAAWFHLVHCDNLVCAGNQAHAHARCDACGRLYLLRLGQVHTDTRVWLRLHAGRHQPRQDRS